MGNLPDYDTEKGVLSLMELAPELGPIFRMELPGTDLVVVSSQELVNELCDEPRFDKTLTRALLYVRDFAGDGLFTAWTEEPNWGAAHRILCPRSGRPRCADVRRHDRHRRAAAAQVGTPGPGAPHRRRGHHHPADLDTIALCSFSYRFNSFYTDAMHPFVGAMVRALVESGARRTGCRCRTG